MLIKWLQKKGILRTKRPNHKQTFSVAKERGGALEQSMECREGSGPFLLLP